ncbi:sm-like protein LSM2 [Hibiscus syriacus]|uniref:sm-like protein LSM2 n=1 Tax=Hibiscus syriacus TaxID=106335 RepID=UPI001923AF12|nr:sm-like protein LSM2 [Hibiscus syriacus]
MKIKLTSASYSVRSIKFSFCSNLLAKPRKPSLFLGRGIEIILFFSYFKDLVGREVTVELKNDLAIRGTLHSVDQYLNIKLENTRVVDQDKYPHMLSVRNCFIRGSVVRYVQLPPDGVDIELLHDATRREARGG